MGIEQDKVIAEALGWTKVDGIEELARLRSYTRYIVEKDGTLTVRFPDGAIKYDYSPSTDDSAALEGINKVCKYTQVLVYFYFDKVRVCIADPEDTIGRAAYFSDELQGEGDTLAAALADAVTEEYCDVEPQKRRTVDWCCGPGVTCKSGDAYKSVCQYLKPRIKPALAVILKGEGQ